MNGTIIDIPGIHANISTFELEHSTDKAQVIEIKDGKQKIEIEICFGRITRIKVNEKDCRNLNK